jgi:hypothetical protein
MRPKFSVASMARVVEAVAAAHDVSVVKLTDDPSHVMVAARRIAIYLCRETVPGPPSFSAIARQFGYRDHGVVTDGYRKIKIELETNERLRAVVAAIQGQLGNVASTASRLKRSVSDDEAWIRFVCAARRVTSDEVESAASAVIDADKMLKAWKERFPISDE